MKYCVTWKELTRNKVVIDANSLTEAVEKAKDFDFDDAPQIETFTIFKESYFAYEVPEAGQLTLNLVEKPLHK